MHRSGSVCTSILNGDPRVYVIPGQKTFDSIVNQGKKFFICIYLISSKRFCGALGSARRQFWLSQREPRIFENAQCVFLGRTGRSSCACISRNLQVGPQELSALQEKEFYSVFARRIWDERKDIRLLKTLKIFVRIERTETLPWLREILESNICTIIGRGKFPSKNNYNMAKMMVL